MPRIGRFSEPVHPDRRDPQLPSGHDVVVEALRDVHVRGRMDPGPLAKDLPVPVRRLVGADLAGDDREVERDPDRRHRRLDEIAIRVGEDREPPAARTRFLQRRTHVLEDRPLGQRPGEVAALALGHGEPLGDDLEVMDERLHRGVELVAGRQHDLAVVRDPRLAVRLVESVEALGDDAHGLAHVNAAVS